MVDINKYINQNIKQQLKAKVSTKKNKSETKAANTAKIADVKSTTKMTSTQVNAGITDGTMSASKAVSTLKSDLNAKVTTTKTANNKTVAKTSVGGKTIVINTNAKDVHITVSNNKIDTAKTLNTGLTPKIITPQIENKTKGELLGTVAGGKTKDAILGGKTATDVIGDKKNTAQTGSLDIVSFESFCALYQDVFSEFSEQDLRTIYDVLDSVSKNKSVDGELLSKAYDIIASLDEDTINKFFEATYSSSSPSQDNNNAARRAPGKKTGEPAIGPRGEYGGNGWFGDYGTDGYVWYGQCLAHNWDRVGGMDNWNGKGAEEMNSGVMLGAFIEWTCLNVAHGVSKLTDAAVKDFNTGVNNFMSTFTIPGYNNGTGKTGSGSWPGNSGGGSSVDFSNVDWNKVVPPTTRPIDNSTWTRGFEQYGSFTVNTGNGTSVEFGPWTAIGTSENDTGGFDGVYTNGQGQAVVIPGSNGNGQGADPNAVQVTSTEVNPDGSTTVTYSDGSKTTTYSDGKTVTTSVITTADGKTVTKTVTTSADGKTIVYAETVKDGGSTTTKYTYEKHKDDGSIEVLYPNGSTVTTSADGKTQTTKDKDGNVTEIRTENPDGSYTITDRNGNQTTTGLHDDYGNTQTVYYDAKTGTTTTTTYTNDGTNGAPAIINQVTDKNGNTQTYVTTTDLAGNTVTIWVDSNGVTHVDGDITNDGTYTFTQDGNDIIVTYTPNTNGSSNNGFANGTYDNGAHMTSDAANYGSIMDGVIGVGGSGNRGTALGSGTGGNPNAGGGYNNPYDPWGGTSSGYWFCGTYRSGNYPH